MISQIMTGLSKVKKRERVPVRASPMSLSKLTTMINYLQKDTVFNELMQGAGVLLATAGAESSKGFGDMADEAATPGGLNERVLQGNGGYGLVADQLDAIF
ncbi:Serine/threonine protein Kinase [Phytophthora cinnamomi]|uniref:Serine/threonine protein Kinase n=1 Tax=Phytophthora cinnamomi TaxID=4785 RepID=UPI003559E818|nr:Serine/threonine protein Kinase [Phytophthora cinnamomi]